MVRWLLPRRRIEQASDMRKGSKRRSNDRMRRPSEKCARRNVLVDPEWTLSRTGHRNRVVVSAEGLRPKSRRRPSLRHATRRDDEISEASLRAAVGGAVDGRRRRSRTATSLGAAAPPDDVTASRFALVPTGTKIAAFAELQGITSEYDIDFIESDGRRFAVPGKRPPPTVTLKRGMTSELELAAWHELAMNDGSAARKNASLVTMTSPARRWPDTTSRTRGRRSRDRLAQGRLELGRDEDRDAVATACSASRRSGRTSKTAADAEWRPPTVAVPVSSTGCSSRRRARSCKIDLVLNRLFACWFTLPPQRRAGRMRCSPWAVVVAGDGVAANQREVP